MQKPECYQVQVPGTGDFPWTHDQLQRYAVLREFLDLFFPDGRAVVLDVGGLSPGREGKDFWLPVKRIGAANSFVLDIAEWRGPDYIRGDGRCLPFLDKKFDVVSALDVVEHIPADERPEFLSELCRVSRNTVVLSAPVLHPALEAAERLLYDQILTLHGVEHRQLREHSERGLPDSGMISLALRERIPSGTSFAYGSLAGWVLHQLLRNHFLLRRNAARIQELLDRLAASRRSAAEFDPPYARHFWIYSRLIPETDLQEGVAKIVARLKDKTWCEFTAEDLTSLDREITAFFTAQGVSALVVASGREKRLEECLNHLLTQNVDFELEPAVLDLRCDSTLEKMIRDRYPGVKYFRAEPGSGTNSAASLLKTAARLSGKYILLLSGNVLLPANAVWNLCERLKADPEAALVVPRIVWKKYFNPVWTGGRFSAKRLLAGRLLRPSRRRVTAPAETSAATTARWVFSECLLFKKESLPDRNLRPRSLRKRNIFLWENAGPAKKILMAPDITVYKKT